MMYFFGGLALFVAFVAWFLFRLYKKDLKQNMHTFYIFLGFIIVWTVIYSVIII